MASATISLGNSGADDENDTSHVHDLINPHELATMIGEPFGKVLIIDSRSFLEYNTSAIQHSVNISCSKLVKRRLQQKMVHIYDLLNNACQVRVDKGWDVIVYDQCTEDPGAFTPDNFVYVLLVRLVHKFSHVSFLSGGFLTFRAMYPGLIVCKTRASNIHTALTSLSQPCLSVSNVGPTRILPFLYLGSSDDALSMETLQVTGINYILNVSKNCPQPAFIQEGHFHRIPIDDSYTDRILPFLPAAFRFLDKVHEANGSVLIHCLAGISRSPTLAIAYIMRHMRMSCDEAYRYVKDKRPTISPNFNFLGQLLQYECLACSDDDATCRNSRTSSPGHLICPSTPVKDLHSNVPSTKQRTLSAHKEDTPTSELQCSVHPLSHSCHDNAEMKVLCPCTDTVLSRMDGEVTSPSVGRLSTFAVCCVSVSQSFSLLPIYSQHLSECTVASNSSAPRHGLSETSKDASSGTKTIPLSEYDDMSPSCMAFSSLTQLSSFPSSRSCLHPLTSNAVGVEENRNVIVSCSQSMLYQPQRLRNADSLPSAPFGGRVTRVPCLSSYHPMFPHSPCVDSCSGSCTSRGVDDLVSAENVFCDSSAPLGSIASNSGLSEFTDLSNVDSSNSVPGSISPEGCFANLQRVSVENLGKSPVFPSDDDCWDRKERRRDSLSRFKRLKESFCLDVCPVWKTDHGRQACAAQEGGVEKNESPSHGPRVLPCRQVKSSISCAFPQPSGGQCLHIPSPTSAMAGLSVSTSSFGAATSAGAVSCVAVGDVHTCASMRCQEKVIHFYGYPSTSLNRLNFTPCYAPCGTAPVSIESTIDTIRDGKWPLDGDAVQDSRTLSDGECFVSISCEPFMDPMNIYQSFASRDVSSVCSTVGCRDEVSDPAQRHDFGQSKCLSNPCVVSRVDGFGSASYAEPVSGRESDSSTAKVVQRTKNKHRQAAERPNSIACFSYPAVDVMCGAGPSAALPDDTGTSRSHSTSKKLKPNVASSERVCLQKHIGEDRRQCGMHCRPAVEAENEMLQTCWLEASRRAKSLDDIFGGEWKDKAETAKCRSPMFSLLSGRCALPVTTDSFSSLHDSPQSKNEAYHSSSSVSSGTTPGSLHGSREVIEVS